MSSWVGEVTDTSKSRQRAVGNRVAWGLAESWTWNAQMMIGCAEGVWELNAGVMKLGMGRSWRAWEERAQYHWVFWAS